MQDSIRDIIYLSPIQTLPNYLRELRGVRWRWVQTPEQMKQLIQFQQGDICVIVRSEFLNQRTAQAFLTWTQLKTRLSLIFIAQTIENAVYQLGLSDSRVLFLRESESEQIAGIVTRRLQGLGVKSRKAERHAVQAEVMLKKSSYSATSPTGGGVQFLREGAMKDFSNGGALIEISEGLLHAKDFVSLMYKDQRGKWVSIESQVRWIASTVTGQQIIGVQFLAVSA
ncbi:PilZ domain-containing protein [Bdellovibrio sp. NC01]|nr:PilZ domain-containing protein [Bdellovibrio sp. NC01]